MAGVLLLLGASGCGAEVSASASKPYAVTATGRLDAASETRYLVAEKDAVIRGVDVRSGQSVHAGDTLVRLACDDSTARLEEERGRARTAAARLAELEHGPLPSEIARREADADVAAARWSDAADRFRRQEALAGEGYAAERTLVAARREEQARKRALEGAQAAVQRLREGAREEEKAAARGVLATAQARVAHAEAELRKCTIEAPTDGTVLRIFRREGEFSSASQGTPLLALGDLGSMIVRAEIDERDAPDVAVGEPAEVWIEGRPGRWSGTVSEVATLMGRRTARSLDPADRFDRETLEVIVRLDETTIPRRVGLRVLVGIRERSGDAALR